MPTSNRPFGSSDRPPRVRNATQVGGSSTPPPRKWCPMVAALVSVKRGQFRKARLYVKVAARLA